PWVGLVRRVERIEFALVGVEQVEELVVIRLADRDEVHLGRAHATPSLRDGPPGGHASGRSRSVRIAGTPSGGVAAPFRSSRTARIPACWPPRTSAPTLSPTMIVSPGGTPARAIASSKIRGCGLR